MLIEIILEAWIALKRNLTRSFLTMLGIVWGIATVTLLIAYGSSFRGVLVHGFDAFGKSVVICWPQQTSEQPGGQRAGQESRHRASRRRHGKGDCAAGETCCRETVRRPGIAYGDRMVGTAAVRGVCPEYGEMRNEVPSEGRWIDASDELERRRVIFLGGRLKEQLFSGRPAVGETVDSGRRALYRDRRYGAQDSAQQLFQQRRRIVVDSLFDRRRSVEHALCRRDAL